MKGNVTKSVARIIANNAKRILIASLAEKRAQQGIRSKQQDQHESGNHGETAKGRSITPLTRLRSQNCWRANTSAVRFRKIRLSMSTISGFPQ